MPLRHLQASCREAEVMNSIPIVDFQSLQGGDPGVNCMADNVAVQQLHSALTTIGFAFIVNHGIDENLVQKAFEVGDEFFNLPSSVKSNYLSQDRHVTYHGYISYGEERLDLSMPQDLKEVYDICGTEGHEFPDKEVPLFSSTTIALYDSFLKLSHRVLHAMGAALKLKDPGFFLKHHGKADRGYQQSKTQMRLCYYPPLPPDREIKPGQARCGEHVDYGSLTLLFQDPSAGLQVKTKMGNYIDVPYIAGAVLVNLGALMQQWTADSYVASPHRVLLPEDESRKRSVRKSIAFFLHPDNDVLIECVDGSNKYPPVLAAENAIKRAKVNY